MSGKIKALLSPRPWWMNLIWAFCLYMTFIYMPFDIFTKPFERWEEVWFGYTLVGWWAKATEPLHWLIYAGGAYGFWKMTPLTWPLATAYSAQVTIAMIVFNLLPDGKGGGPIAAAVSGSIFMLLTIALWRSKKHFQSSSTT